MSADLKGMRGRECECLKRAFWQRPLRGEDPARGGCWLCSPDSREARVAGAEEAEVAVGSVVGEVTGNRLCGALAANGGVWI